MSARSATVVDDVEHDLVGDVGASGLGRAPRHGLRPGAGGREGEHPRVDSHQHGPRGGHDVDDPGRPRPLEPPGAARARRRATPPRAGSRCRPSAARARSPRSAHLDAPRRRGRPAPRAPSRPPPGESPCRHSDAASTSIARAVDRVDRHRRARAGPPARRPPPDRRAARPASPRGTSEPSGQVAAIEERLAHERQACVPPRRGRSRRRGRASAGRPGSANRPRPRARRRRPAPDPRSTRVVERAVRLDVAEVGSRLEEGARAGAAMARCSSVGVAGAAGRGRSSPDPGYDGCAPTATPNRVGAGDRVAHGRGIPGMPAAGDAGARDDREHRLVVGRRHTVDRLAEVGVEVDARHGAHASRVPLRLRGASGGGFALCRQLRRIPDGVRHDGGQCRVRHDYR